VAEGLEGTLQFLFDLCGVQAVSAAGESARIAAELVFGYQTEEAPDSAAFFALQNRLTLSLAGSRLAKDRAAVTVASVMIPEALDYPAAG
jgi:hypothetical protein